MAYLVLNISRHHHGVSDFLAQELLVTLTQPAERLLHRVLTHTQFIGNLPLRWAVRFIHEQRFQPLKKDHIASRTILFTKAPQDLLQQGQRPATLVDLVDSRSVRRLKTGALALAHFVQWNQPPAFAPLNGDGALALVR